MKYKHSGFKLKSSGFSPAVIGLGLLYAFMLVFAGCKTPTPVVADCDPGFLPCENDQTQCCEVICSDGYYLCGPDSTDCCENCPIRHLPCEDDDTACCEVTCPELYYNCGDMLTNCCIDTTSHQFSFAVDTIGIYGSYLNDVAIVNENDIWVVGNIETDSTSYNAAHYNGEEWELIKIQPQGYVQPLGSIYYFSENNIWFSLSTLPIRWDGESYYLYTPANDNYPGGSIINEIWASSVNDIYFVGSGGGIVHYDGSSFVQMASGTDVDLKDIAGTPDGEHVFAVGWDATYPAPCIVLELINNTWNTLYYTEGYQPVNGNNGWIWSVDTFGDTAFFPSAEGLWKYNFIDRDSLLIPNSVSHMDESAFKSVNIISGNDIFFGGSGFHYLHFNGGTYLHSHEITDMFPQRALNGADYNGDIAVMVGYCCSWGHALIALGYHH